jgi:VanZ family protein
MSTSPAQRDPDRTVARVFWIVTALFVLFILAASLLPYGVELTFVAPGERSFLRLPTPASFRAHGLRDIATNVLLYLPLGLFLGLAMSTRRLRFFSPGLLVGPLLSLVVEIAQGFIGRMSDLVDVVTNSTGHLIGLALAAIAINRFGLRPGHLIGLHLGDGARDDRSARAQTVAAVRLLYICVYVVVALLPFNISVSLSRIYAQLLPEAGGQPLIIVDPLHHLRQWPSGSWSLLFDFLGLVPVGLLTALVDFYRRRFNVFGPVLVCLVTAVAGETLKLFNLSRTTDVSTVIVAFLAGAAGVAAARLWFGLQRQADAVTGSGPPGADPRARRLRMVGLACVVYALFLALLSWYPYEFETNLRTVFSKIRHEANWLPFRAHFSVRSLGSAIDIVKETGLFVPFGLLGTLFVTSARAGTARRTIYLLVCALCFAYAGFLELTQAMCVGRFIDTTDLLLAATGGAVGVALSRLLSARVEPRS